MKIPKATTIRSKYRVYAYKAGFTILPQTNGLYNVFDNKMGYTTHRNRNMTEIVQIIVDGLNMKEYNRKNRSSVVVG
jgi:hypothetical protein